MRRIAPLALLLVLASFSLAEPAPPYRPPSKAIPFYGHLLDGGRFDLADYLGQTPLVLNFWASWCGPCRQEARTLEIASKRYRERVAFVGVSVQDPSESAAAFVQEFGLTFPVVQDGAADVAWAYRVTGLPTTFFINDAGEIVAIHRGPLYPQRLERYLQILLKGQEER